jgi:hypothetical protein
VSENIFQTRQGDTVIFNGGDPLPGCPSSWDEARSWTALANGDYDKHDAPLWSFDCGFKLDFDGPLVSLSSRFYPPKTHYGHRWDGTVSVNLLGARVAERKFDCNSLEELRTQVEAYRDEIVDTLKKAFQNREGG